MDVSTSEGSQMIFLTLTLRKSYHGIDPRGLLQKLLPFVIRKCNEMFGEYHLVVEPTSKGVPHMHVLAWISNYTKWVIFLRDWDVKYGHFDIKNAYGDPYIYLHKSDSEKNKKSHKIAFREYFNELFHCFFESEDINRHNYKLYRTFLRKYMFAPIVSRKTIFDYF